MKQKTVLIILIFLIALITYLYLNNWYQKIEIYNAKDYGKNESNPILSITDKHTFNEISAILRTSERMQGVIDMAPPQYFLEVYRFNTQVKSVLLWIKEDSVKGVFEYKEATEVGYKISEKNAQKLKKLIILKAN